METPGFRSHRYTESLPVDGGLAVSGRVPLLHQFARDVDGRRALTPVHREGCSSEVREAASGCRIETGGEASLGGAVSTPDEAETR